MNAQEAKTIVESIDLAKYNLEKGNLDVTEIAQIVGDYTGHHYEMSETVVPEIEAEVMILEHLVEAVCPLNAGDAHKINKAFDILRDTHLLSDQDTDKAIVLIMTYLRHQDIMYYDVENPNFQDILCNILCHRRSQWINLPLKLGGNGN